MLLSRLIMDGQQNYQVKCFVPIFISKISTKIMKDFVGLAKPSSKPGTYSEELFWPGAHFYQTDLLYFLCCKPVGYIGHII